MPTEDVLENFFKNINKKIYKILYILKIKFNLSSKRNSKIIFDLFDF